MPENSGPAAVGRPPSSDRLSQRLVAWVLGRAAATFVRIESVGDPIPPGPVMVVANHYNSLVDPLVLFRVAGRPTCPLAKAPLFDQRLVGGMLRVLGGLPVYRREDDSSQMGRNEETFRAAVAALEGGAAIQIFPEGKSHSEPSLEPLKTGAARIALRAEALRPEGLGLRIVPVGLTYEDKQRFRGRVLAEIGEPFPVARWLDAYRTDEQGAVRDLTDEMARRLAGVTLNLEAPDDRALIVAASRAYTRAKGIHRWRERESMASHVPTLREFARGLSWLRGTDPRRFERLAASVREQDRIGRALGARQGSVPARYGPAGLFRYLLVEGLALILGLPLAAAGTVIWYPTWIAPRWVLPRVRPVPEAVATYKLATGLVAVPLTLAVFALIGWWAGGWISAGAAAAAAVVLGLIAMGWRERWGRVREDITLFWRILRHARLRDRLAESRERLVREIDDVARELRRGERSR